MPSGIQKIRDDGNSRLQTTGVGYWGKDSVWQAAPAPLVAMSRAGVLARNKASEELLSRTLGGSETGWDRWLQAALLRLLAGAESMGVLAADPRRHIELEVQLAPSPAGTDEWMLGLREMNGNVRRATDLVETISTLSHEFRTPLASMKSSLALVLNEDTGPLLEDQKNFLGMTMRNIERLERLVGDLLDVGRADAGKLPLHPRDVDLGPILADAVAMHRTAAQAAGLVLDDSALPTSFTAHVDPDKVLQMLANVLSNSVKYCRQGNRILVRVESPGSEKYHPAIREAQQAGFVLNTFELVIQDNGPGIDQDRLGEVFDPFSRSHDEAESRTPGAGLGLHITRGLAAAHAGSLHLASEPGLGTTVRILLPRDEVSGRWMRARSENAPTNPDSG